MKITELIKERVDVNKIDWVDDPSIGWILESSPCRIYYGAQHDDLVSIMENGIYASDDGYVKCSMEPRTAHFQATPLTESIDNDNRVVLVIDIPESFSAANPLYTDFDREKDLYESWGKSDSEFYALYDISVPKHIPVEYIKGYMIKNDS